MFKYLILTRYKKFKQKPKLITVELRLTFQDSWEQHQVH